MAVMPENREPLCTLLEDHGVDPKSVVADSVWLYTETAQFEQFLGGGHFGNAVVISRRIALRREPLMWYLACTQAHDERKR